MRAYRLRSGRTIAPFGDSVRDLHVATKTIGEWQVEACRACGLELIDIDSVSEIRETPAVAFWDDVFFTEMALRQFVADCASGGEEAQLAMPDSPVWGALAPLQDARAVEGGHAFDVFFLPKPLSAGDDRVVLRGRARPRAMPLRERAVAVRLPKVDSAPGAIQAPITARIVCTVSHWLHLLRLSQLAVGVLLLDHLRANPRRIFALRWAARRGPWAVARKMVFVHETAEIHPTADLEAAIIGPGSIVRAHAHVHQSVLGSGVDVGDHAVVVGSTLADRVQVLRASYLALCAAMPGGTLASYKVQLSLFGRDVFLTSSALLLDAKLKGTVRVEQGGELIDVGTPFLGACLGHRARLGAQVAIAPGRAIPNDAVIVPPPGVVAQTIGASASEGVSMIRDGRVVPIDAAPGDGELAG
ncbi:MAG: hypothetical protein IT384_23270 [Deltaproteobacteria bacterium]|nr:hypothetical protein [Deltaproteobacteria bacterium]